MKYILLTILLFLISCEKAPQPSQKEVAQLYVDIQIAQENYKTMIDSMKIAVDSLYNFHDISKDIYTSSLESYKNDEEKWNNFFDLATEYLNTLKAIDKRKLDY